MVDTPFSYANLRKNPRRFFTPLGVTVEQFDAILGKLLRLEVERQKKRLPLRSPKRIEPMVTRYADTLREHLCITLLYLRRYNVQEVIATAFGISRGQVSKIIRRILPLLEALLKVLIYGNSAYEAITALFPEWIPRTNEKGKRNHPLTGEQKLHHNPQNRIRILIERVSY